jgi:hypothetical protein
VRSFLLPYTPEAEPIKEFQGYTRKPTEPLPRDRAKEGFRLEPEDIWDKSVLTLIRLLLFVADMDFWVDTCSGNEYHEQY